jgi:hypothetical protein
MERGRLQRDQEGGRFSGLAEMHWDEIDRPGCYLLLGTGVLVRMPRAALSPGSLPLISLLSRSGPIVARMSDDPAESIDVLRAIAESHAYAIDF